MAKKKEKDLYNGYIPDFIVDNLNRLSDKRRIARNLKGDSTRDLTKEIDKEAMMPVRKTEAGKYDGQNMSNLIGAGNDEDGDSLKK